MEQAIPVAVGVPIIVTDVEAAAATTSSSVPIVEAAASAAATPPLMTPTIPLATNVIVIPHEPTREDTERFWNIDIDDADADEQQPKPKDGIGCMKGWVQEISPFYTIYYIALVILVTISLIGLSGVFGPPCVDGYSGYSWCYKRSTIFILQHVTLALYLLFILARIVCCCGPCADHTYNYLRNRMDADKVQKLLDQYRQDIPQISLHVKCWHTETRGTGDDRKTVTVTTYTAQEQVPLRSCSDMTEGLDHVNLYEYRMTKLKLTKSFVPDQKFLDRKDALYHANKHRDTHCAITEHMEIRGFEPYILVHVVVVDIDNDNDNKENSLWQQFLLNPSTYALVHLLLFPALPYRIWLCSITGKIKLEIRKKIETSDE